MAEESSFDELVERLRKGDEDAAAEIFRQYVRRLVGLARKHLDERVRRKVGADDVVNSALKSFFIGMREGEFELKNRNNLWSLLAVITMRKCGHKVRELYRQQRDIRREVYPRLDDDDPVSGWRVLAAGPTPAEAAIMAETLEQFLAELRERERRIVELHLQGLEVPKIQAEVKRSAFTVNDVLRHVRNRLERQTDQDDA
jgi:RNA polymerase sigma-70 factor (ECF subfamily)